MAIVCPGNYWKPLWIGLAFILLLDVGVSSAHAQDQLALDVEIGFNGQYFPDQYAPIRVEIEYRGPPLVGELVIRQDSSRLLGATRTLEVKRDIQLGQSAHQLHELYFPLSAYPPPEGDEPELIVSIRAQGKEIISRHMKLLNLIAPDPLVLALSDTSFPSHLPTGESIQQVDRGELPSSWRGYAGVRRIYLGDFRASTLTPEQQEALRGWLFRGGELVVFAGENFYIQNASWLRELLPFRVEDVHFIEALGAIAAVGQPLGEVVHSEAGWPILVRGRFGGGWIYFSALDPIGSAEMGRHIWEKLSSKSAEVSGPPLGLELFHEMEVRYPSKLWILGLLAIYATGFGLLSLWLLHRMDIEQLEGWRVFLVLAGWIALVSGLMLAYLKQPEFASRTQSLEVGLIRGGTQVPLALEKSWYSVLAKRPVQLELAVEREALVLPLEGTNLAIHLQPDQLQMTFSPPQLQTHQQAHLYIERLIPLQIGFEVRDEPGSVRGTVVRVYNQSSWPLRGVILFQGGIYYPLGDLPAGAVWEGPLDHGEGAWLKFGNRSKLNFEERVKQRLYSEIQDFLEQGEHQGVLLAWVAEESLRNNPAENRWTLKLLMIES